MRGRNTLWALGIDHAGIATQAVVESELRERGDLAARASAARRSSSGSGSGRSSTARRSSSSTSASGPPATTSASASRSTRGTSRAVYRVFKALYEKGLIYRDNYMVNWDPGSRSAISDLEVEDREVEDTLYEIDYPVEGSERVLTVATVRPETMLADTAVAVHPDDERYRDLIGEHCDPAAGRPSAADHRRRARRSRVRNRGAQDHPGHDPNDFEIGRAHGLEEIVGDRRGRPHDEAAGERFAGLTVAEAREAVVAALRDEGGCAPRSPTSTRSPSPIARASGSSR